MGDLLDSLHTALAFNYWVGTIGHEGLRDEDWINSCALLVFPHCNDRRPYDALDRDLTTISRIRQFVTEGGSFLGVCGGAYFASRTAWWNGAQWGSATLALWPGLSRGPHLDEGAQTHEIILPFVNENKLTNGPNTNTNTEYCDLHYDGGGEFVCEGVNASASFTVMGCYSTEKYAGVQCAVGAGQAVLWHARLERSFRSTEVKDGYMRSYDARHFDVEVCFEECF